MTIATSAKKTAELLELSPTVTKLSAAIGTLGGFFYLFAYAQDRGIPFPLQLNVLPLTLLIIGLSAICGVILLAGGIMVPSLLADDPLGVTKEFLIARDFKTHRIRTRFYRWFVCVMAPMLFALGSMIAWLSEGKENTTWHSALAGSLTLIAVVWVPLTPLMFRPLRSKWVQYSLSILFQTLLAVWAYGLLIIVIVAVEPSVGKLSIWGGSATAFAIFAPLYFLATFPPSGSQGTLVLLPPNYDYRAAPSSAIATAFAIFAAVMSMLIYPVNARIGSAALKAFRIGGNIPIVICLKDPPNRTIAKQISLDTNNCSEKLALLFDGGDRIYLNALNSNAAKVVPFSVRQDDVLVKKYPSQ